MSRQNVNREEEESLLTPEEMYQEALQCSKDGDMESAAEWYRKAAEQGDAKAQFNLGHCYYYGEGVEQDDILATEWFRKAAEQGFSDAQHGLAVCYETGIGVGQNMSQAIFWYKKAAEQGCDAAIEKLEELERKKDESLFNKLKKWISSDLPS